MKHVRQLAAGMLMVWMLCILSSCQLKSQEELFDQYLTDVFKESVVSDSITLHFMLKDPEAYGIDRIEPTLGSISLEADGEESASESLKILKKFKYSQLSEEQKMCYSILEAYLTVEQMAEGMEYYVEICSPGQGIQAQLPTLLAEYKFYVEEDIQDYVALLHDTKRYFQEVIAFEQEKSEQGLFMADFSLDEVIQGCQDFVDAGEDNVLLATFRERLDAFDGLSGEQKAIYEEQNVEAVAVVVSAYETFMEEMEKLRGTGVNDGGLCNFDRGQEYYEYLVASGTGSSKSVDEIANALQKRLIAESQSMYEYLMMDESILDLADHPPYDTDDPATMLEELKERIAEDFPAIPEVHYEVKEVAESLQGSTSPAFYLIPAIDNAAENVIYINPSEEYAHMDLFPTIAHEGYPGHLYQNVYYNSTNPPLFRHLLSFLGYSEGWANYVEGLSYEYFGFENEALVEILKCNSYINIQLSALLDIGIHYYGWDLEDLQDYLSQFGIEDEDDVRDTFEYIVGNPSAYLSYAVGGMEILELRENAENELGDAFSLKDFHKAILDAGPAPFSIVEEFVDAYIEQAAA
ncbi:DUF885 domain-containing protein [Bianquea renquensis]|uniref:DUF885 domain-containing protein n=1 Tax=Bianquea renquensis TaxID=2763661 RepID=A0A926I067_9FIRM|nr:DUF885 domain-containing protein [Bianquea renquensis]MBC8542148.1 DUF885 domain-containing protein [Bianquea renquensis]